MACRRIDSSADCAWRPKQSDKTAHRIALTLCILRISRYGAQCRFELGRPEIQLAEPAVVRHLSLAIHNIHPAGPRLIRRFRRAFYSVDNRGPWQIQLPQAQLRMLPLFGESPRESKCDAVAIVDGTLP